MSKDEVIHESSTGGKKAGNLQRASLVPPVPFLELAEHFGKGSKKYDDHNWLKGYDWSLSFDALMRHAWAFWNGEDIDEETGSKHIIAAMWHCAVLAEFMERYPEFDDRPVRFLEKQQRKNDIKKLAPSILRGWMPPPRDYGKGDEVPSLTPAEREWEWVSRPAGGLGLMYVWRDGYWGYLDRGAWICVSECVPTSEGPFVRL